MSYEKNVSFLVYTDMRISDINFSGLKYFYSDCTATESY